MTDCTLFKLWVTFPLRELLHYKILIKAEPPVTSWFPLMAEAAANIKAGVTSLNWGQGVKLDNRLFVCGFSLSFPDLSKRPRGCEPCTISCHWHTESHNRQFMVWGHQELSLEATDANSLSDNLSTHFKFLQGVFMETHVLFEYQLHYCASIYGRIEHSCEVLCLSTQRS